MKLLYDFLPIVLFFAAYNLYGIYVATGVAIVASLVMVCIGWLRHRKVERMHLVSLVIITVMGGLTLWLQDKAFVMWKPTLINWLFAAVFAGTAAFGKPLVQRLLDGQLTLEKPVWSTLNWMWVGFFVVSGAANLFVARHYLSAEDALRQAVPEITAEQLDPFDCERDFTGDALTLCRTAADRESFWVNFKLFGLLGLTVVFIVGQAVYLGRHMETEDDDGDAPDAPT
ncbi:MAG: inner membrane-spanning protein YciB [Pseudomonadota bacterium]